MAILVPNARNVPVLIDEIDAERVLAHRWAVFPDKAKDKCVRQWKENGKPQREALHLFILGRRPGFVIDHINGNRLDNRRGNLRFVTPRENTFNQRVYTGRSTYKGVCPSRRPSNPWRAQISIGGRQSYLGSFQTEEAAARAYDEAARSLFGNCAALNFPRRGRAPLIALHP